MIKKNIRIKLTSLREATNDHFFGQMLGEEMDEYEEFEDEIENKNILIIDDVFTTGSTLNECTKTLKKKNPKCVYCATFAKTKFNINAQN